MSGRKLYSGTREILIDRFVRSRTSDEEGTSRADLFAYGSLMMLGTKKEKKAGGRSVTAAMKYADVPSRVQNSIVHWIQTSNKAEIADLCKELRPHTEVRQMLEAYI